MKRAFRFIGYAIFMLALVGCSAGVSQEEYDKVAAENTMLKERISELEAEQANSQCSETVFSNIIEFDKDNIVSVEINNTKDGLAGVAICSFDGKDVRREWCIIASLSYEFMENGIENVAITIDSNGEAGLIAYIDGEFSKASVIPNAYDVGMSSDDVEDYSDELSMVRNAFSAY